MCQWPQAGGNIERNVDQLAGEYLFCLSHVVGWGRINDWVIGNETHQMRASRDRLIHVVGPFISGSQAVDCGLSKHYDMRLR